MKIEFRMPRKIMLLGYILSIMTIPVFADDSVNINPIEPSVPKPKDVVVTKPKVITYVSPPVSHVTPAILNDTALRKWVVEGNRSSALIV